MSELAVEGAAVLGPEGVGLIKKLYAKDATDLELDMFVYQCKRTGLDPILKQIYFIKRRQGDSESMTIQVSIDGFRLIADRTGLYAGSDDPIYSYDDSGRPVSASVTVWKIVKDGRYPFTATAYYDEYVQKDRQGLPVAMWRKMPRNQLGKCAEALALRKGFPANLSGLHIPEEMEQADNPDVPTRTERVAQRGGGSAAASDAVGINISDGPCAECFAPVGKRHLKSCSAQKARGSVICEPVPDKHDDRTAILDTMRSRFTEAGYPPALPLLPALSALLNLAYVDGWHPSDEELMVCANHASREIQTAAGTAQDAAVEAARTNHRETSARAGATDEQRTQIRDLCRRLKLNTLDTVLNEAGVTFDKLPEHLAGALISHLKSRIGTPKPTIDPGHADVDPVA